MKPLVVTLPKIHVHVQNVCLATAICLVIFLLLRTWKRRYIYYRAAKVKGPFPLPVIGSTYVLWGHTQGRYGHIISLDHESLSDLLEGLIRLNKKYGSLYKFWTGTKLCFFASKPEEVQIVLNSCAEKYQDMKYLNPVFGKGLLTLLAPEWKIHRKLLRGTFSQEILNSFVKTYVVYSNIMVGKLEESLGKGLVDVFPFFSLCMTDILCDTMMGVQVNTMKENGYNLILQTARLGELGCLRTANPLLHPDILWNRTSLSKETRTILEEVQQFIKKIVDTKRLEKAKNVACASQKPILLNRMLELEDTEKIWDEQMSLEETQAVLVAGADATTLTLGYVLMMLGMHQEIQVLLAIM
ncbi:cytochrome P450 4C1-like [Zophobas morio]|uniref:cytochrome P450 4C1-like n=1 Tax=Zophobas morio TaxID=2755281 RepID=UPI003082ADF4